MKRLDWSQIPVEYWEDTADALEGGTEVDGTASPEDACSSQEAGSPAEVGSPEEAGLPEQAGSSDEEGSPQVSEGPLHERWPYEASLNDLPAVWSELVWKKEGCHDRAHALVSRVRADHSEIMAFLNAKTDAESGPRGQGDDGSVSDDGGAPA